jgi:hypothetical protein
MSRTLIATAAAAALLTLPASALAMHEPDGAPATAPASTPTNYLRDGKYRAHPTTLAATQISPRIVRVVKPAGFDFRDAGIGAALGALFVAALCSALILNLRSRDLAVAAGSAAP